MTKRDSIYVYDSVKEFTDWLTNTKQTRKGAKLNASRLESDSNTTFTGTTTFAEAQSLLQNGDTKLSKMVFDMGMKIKAKSNTGYMRANSIANSPQGFTPNIGAYMTGHPNNMISIRQSFKPMSKVINIVYVCSVPWDIKTNQMISAASKVACAVSTLEAKGYRVNIYVGAHALSSIRKAAKPRLTLLVKIKDAGKPIDPLRIAYPLAHPSMFRRHIFAFMERADWSLPDGYGMSISLSQERVKPVIGRCVVLNGLEIIKSDKAMDTIVKQIEEQSKKL